MPPLAITVHPGAALRGTLRPPGDKSISHRAVLLAALAAGTSRIENPNPGDDVAATLGCLEQLGATTRREADAVLVTGVAMRPLEPEHVLACGNSGTTLRLLAGPLAAQPFLSVLAGDASLHRRPVDRVIAPLASMGATLRARAGDRLPPLVIQGGPLRAIEARLPVASAQVASAVALAGLFAAGTTRVQLPGLARDHTARLLPLFGAEAARGENAQGAWLSVQGPARLEAAQVRVPGDFSAAAFFLAAAAAGGGTVTACDVGLNPTRTGLLEVLEGMGAQVERTVEGEAAGEPIGRVTVTGPDRLRGFDPPRDWLPRWVDEVPAWAMAAALAEGTSRLTGAAELRLKESDRLATLAHTLGAVGIRVRELEDGLEIEGGTPTGGTVRAAGDHRIAMALALLGCAARGPITIDDATAIATSFPGFVPALVSLGGRCSTAEEAA